MGRHKVSKLWTYDEALAYRSTNRTQYHEQITCVTIGTAGLASLVEQYAASSRHTVHVVSLPDRDITVRYPDTLRVILSTDEFDAMTEEFKREPIGKEVDLLTNKDWRDVVCAGWMVRDVQSLYIVQDIEGSHGFSALIRYTMLMFQRHHSGPIYLFDGSRWCRWDRERAKWIYQINVPEPSEAYAVLGDEEVPLNLHRAVRDLYLR